MINEREIAKKKPKVMFLLSTLTVGGSERKSVRIANSLAQGGKKMTIAYLNAPHTLRDDISDNVDVLFLDRKGKFSFGALQRLITYVSRYKIDVICCMNLFPLLYAYLARSASSANWFRLLGATNVTSFVSWKDVWQMFLYAPILRRIDMTIFGSLYQENLWIRQYKLNASKCCYIHNGVDVALFHQTAVKAKRQNIRAELRIPEAGLLIGSVGRFRKEKQYEMVIQACMELREKRRLDVYCLLVGGGQEEKRLRDMVAKLRGEEYVHILEAANDVRSYLVALDVFVLSSISETFSNSALEAMAMELPVVLPRVGGCPEMVDQGVNGFLFDSGDTADLVKYLSFLCTDQGLRLKMGQAARKHVERRFRFEAMVESYKDLFEKQSCV